MYYIVTKHCGHLRAVEKYSLSILQDPTSFPGSLLFKRRDLGKEIVLDPDFLSCSQIYSDRILNFFFSLLQFILFFYFSKKKWVGRAMENEIKILGWPDNLASSHTHSFLFFCWAYFRGSLFSEGLYYWKEFFGLGLTTTTA